jgi:predicted O-linked N-acetylglucosamine transferase (SPINDLY family)
MNNKQRSSVMQVLSVEPSAEEVNSLISLFGGGKYAEMEAQAKVAAVKYPRSGLVWKILGVALSVQGKDALQALENSTKLLPNDAEAHYNFATALRVAGQLSRAKQSFEHALKINPAYAEALSGLGNTLRDLGEFESAIERYRSAISVNPSYAEAHYNLATTLKDIGMVDASVSSFRNALTINPSFAEAHNNLGNALRALGRLSDAEVHQLKAVALRPTSAEFNYNLGTTQLDQGQASKAISSFNAALALNPVHAESHCNLGNAYRDIGRLNDAVIAYTNAVQLNPGMAIAHNNLGATLKNMGRLDDAIKSLSRALELKPDFAECHGNLGAALRDLGQFDAAGERYKTALHLSPGLVEAHCNMGVVLRDQGRLQEALLCFQEAAVIKPSFPDVHNGLAMTLQALWRPIEAEKSFRRAVELDPNNATYHSNLLFHLELHPSKDTSGLCSEYQNFEQKFEAPFVKNWPTHSNIKDAAKVLRVGFVSGDLRNHSIANFIEPIINHLAAMPQLQLHAYNNFVHEDAVTKRISQSFAHWTSVYGVSDADLAQQILDDGIDILIDLSGHSGYNRLQTFARKPAPIQVTWMGFPGTTGLQAMDYYLSDQYFLPPGEFDSQFTERIVHLPASAVFQPSPESPPVTELPALRNGYVTFGSFNRPNKISRDVIRLWSQVLHALPDARLLLAAMPADGTDPQLLEWFQSEGIDPQRLSFHKMCALTSYLGLHAQVDICLDTFPYNGGTTTLHALWMGVPTLTLAGTTAAGRTGASILGHVGLNAFLATSEQDFVQKGHDLASDLDALSTVRVSLRERFLRSSMGQPAVVAAGLESALRAMWLTWCNRQVNN